MAISEIVFVDIVLALVVLGHGYIAARRGFLASIVKMVSYIIVFAVCAYLSQTFAPAIYESVVQPYIIEQKQEQLEEEIKNNAVFVGTDPSQLQAAIEMLPGEIREQLPDAVSDLLDQDLEETLSQEAIAASIVQTVEASMRPMIENVVYVILFVILSTILSVLVNLLIKALDVVNKLPVLGACNSFLGFLLGLVQGTAMLWILIHIFEVFFSLFPDEFAFFQSVWEESFVIQTLSGFNPLYLLFR